MSSLYITSNTNLAVINSYSLGKKSSLNVLLPRSLSIFTLIASIHVTWFGYWSAYSNMVGMLTVLQKNAYICIIFLWFIANMLMVYFFFIFPVDCLKISGGRIFIERFSISICCSILLWFSSVNKNISIYWQFHLTIRDGEVAIYIYLHHQKDHLTMIC